MHNRYSNNNAIEWTYVCVRVQQFALQPTSRWNFWISYKLACISPHVRTDLRSQNKAQGPASRCQGSQHPKGILGFIPKTSNIFQSPPAAQALISKCPQWPRAHKHCPSLLSGGWTWNLSASPGAPSTRRTDPVCPEPAWDPVGGASNDAEGAEAHTGGRFHFLHISQRLFAHSCWTQRRAREGFTPWEIITHNPHGPVSLGSYKHSLKFQMPHRLMFTRAEPQ